MDLFTGITKNVGLIAAKIEDNNLLISELNKKYNPTFLEIIKELQKSKDDSVLLALLLTWYINKYSVDESELNKIMNKIRNEAIDISGLYSKRKPMKSGCSNDDEDGYWDCTGYHSYKSHC